jgi:hypothetical protein
MSSCAKSVSLKCVLIFVVSKGLIIVVYLTSS